MSKKKILVVDSSVIVKWINTQDENHVERADKILRDVRQEKVLILTSELAKFEIGNALLKRKQLDLPHAYASLGTIYALPVTFVPETEDLARTTYRLGEKLNITYYDASFLSIAKTYKAILVTDNVKHQGKQSEVKVVPLAKY